MSGEQDLQRRGGPDDTDEAAAMPAPAAETDASSPLLSPPYGEDDDCPVCLEPLASFAASEVACLPSCQHAICIQCLTQLYHVQQANAHTNGQLSCPICRASHPIADRSDVSAVLRQLGGFSGVGAQASAQDCAAVRGLGSLRPQELKQVAAVMGVHIPLGGWLDRQELENAIRAKHPDTTPGTGGHQAGEVDFELEQLPIRALKALLTYRGVPFDDCVERAELQQRVRETPRGSLSRLAVPILRRMLLEYDGGADTASAGATIQLPAPTGTELLARRVMAARAEARHREQSQRQQQQQRQQRRTSTRSTTSTQQQRGQQQTARAAAVAGGRVSRAEYTASSTRLRGGSRCGGNRCCVIQ